MSRHPGGAAASCSRPLLATAIRPGVFNDQNEFDVERVAKAFGAPIAAIAITIGKSD